MRWYHKILIAIAVIVLLGLVVMFLWNALAPELFGLDKITYGQAVGLFLLCRLLFGGHNHDHKHSSDWHKNARNYRPRLCNWLAKDRNWQEGGQVEEVEKVEKVEGVDNPTRGAKGGVD
ncbi:MAG: hypothetical protein LBP51_01635 [Deferribacteraceae bacterium]|jgi:hypothetical protein|nr:hypothetical protein [Deferribacteraceae bacterium]